MTAMVKGQLFDHPDGRIFCLRAIARHRIGDWGDIAHEDSLANNRVWSGVKRLPWESQLKSSYPIPERLREETSADDDRLWIITGASGRSYLLYPWEQ